ncbi:MAG TPA: tRNA (adenosine(37)-N6)-threonylcarbamoyltransferase complex dimerization subunit type 1 TsaB [Kineosporiaceae bacterium]|nr:tRNA (adenosine(37)-N6)-threonylcarbamoyltransferase complex dimerization subunit type 1 TsaB [Kineosporiaceae bacterium]
MLLLAVDTSGAQVSVALHDGGRLLARRDVADPRRHAEVLAPSLTAVLAEAGRQIHEVSDVAVGVGPGPFTGLRVGLVTADMLGHVLGVPVHGVCSLDGLALAAVRAGTAGPAEEFCVATDARRREVYWARYRGGRRLAGPAVDAPADLPRDGLPVIGRGGLLYPEVLGPVREPFDVSAADVAELAVAALSGDPEVEGLLPPEPLYLRRPDAVEPAARKRVLR